MIVKLMTFYEKYPQLQQVSKDKVQEIRPSLLSNEELERTNLNGNQANTLISV
jgi:hypothetical protein